MGQDMNRPDVNAPLHGRSKVLGDELDRCLALLISGYAPDKIILFGSLATGNVQEWSDIDLVIIKETDKPFLDRTREVMRLLRPRAGIDVMVYTPKEFDEIRSSRRFFREEVMAKGKVVYDART
jgi:predicted nucleotidyltransferase